MWVGWCGVSGDGWVRRGGDGGDGVVGYRRAPGGEPGRAAATRVTRRAWGAGALSTHGWGLGMLGRGVAGAAAQVVDQLDAAAAATMTTAVFRHRQLTKAGTRALPRAAAEP